MIRSMTGFAKKSLTLKEGICTAEIRSVNRRHLDLKIILPQGWESFETPIRKLVHQKVERGSLYLKITAPSTTPILDKNSLKGLAAIASEMKTSLGIENQAAVTILFQANPSAWFKEPVIQIEKESLINLIQEALETLNQSRLEEGQALKTTLLGSIQSIPPLTKEIEGFSKNAMIHHQEKLQRNLVLLTETPLEDERLLKEIALLADKADITEELVRLKHHLKVFEKALSQSDLVSGKMLEFRLQEMFREINTLASKTPLIEVSDRAVTIKHELEKIKEQLFNIE